MKRSILCLTLYIAFTCCASGIVAQENKDSKASRTLTPLGTIKGEVSKVSDGGNKIEVKYKELVTTTTRSSSSSGMRGAAASKVRPPASKELTLKEKNQELELRLFDKTVVRQLEAADTTTETKSSSKRKSSSKSTTKNNDMDENDKKDENKTESKAPSKATKKSGEATLPGKAVEPSALAKGQIVIVAVSREDLPGYSRLIATSVYILGEK